MVEYVISMKGGFCNADADLVECYKLDNEYKDTPFDELPQNLQCISKNRDKFPKVTDRIKFKGTLRIAWSYDMKYNKHIDLIFFPEENPYLNYAYLYAKDFPKKISNEDNPREIIEMQPNYDINYEFVKEILSKAGMDTYHRKRFFEVRFGTAMFVPMEIEFEWYIGIGVDTESFPEEGITFPCYDKYLVYTDEANGDCPLYICVGIIKSYSVLPINTKLNYDYTSHLAYIDYDTDKPITYKEVFTPIPINALATTMTKVSHYSAKYPNDFFVNLRDKPSSKEGKILSQLFSHKLHINYDVLDKVVPTNNEDFGEPTRLFDIIATKGRKLYHKYEEAGSTDDEGYIYYYQCLLQKVCYKNYKSKMINPLWRDTYLIYVQNTLPNNWAKVWVIKPPDDNTKALGSDHYFFKEAKEEIFGYQSQWNLGSIKKFITPSYMDTFHNSPSQIKLYEGYIHTSGLDYLMPFGENYIKR